MGIGTALAVLAGARRDVLAKAPSDLSKHVAMGGVLLSTAAVAGVSAFFALHSVLALPWQICVPAGIGWAVVVLNLDRMLVVTMGGQNSLFLKIMTAIPRVLLALVIGWVISTPLVLQVFRPEIAAELTTMKAEAIGKAQQTLDKTYERINELVAQRQQLQDAIDRKPQPVTTNADVQNAQTNYENAERIYLGLNAEAQCELDGTCGTGVPGVGTAYLRKKEAADAARQGRDDAKRKLDATIDRVTKENEAAAATARAAAQAQLPDVERALAKDREARRAAEDEVHRVQDGNTGLLARLEALDRVTSGHMSAAWAHRMLFLLFVCIEVLPVAAKLLSGIGAPTLYDRLIQHEDDEIDGTARIWVTCEREIAATAADARRTVAKQQAEAQIAAGRVAAAALGDQQEAVTLRAIEAWGQVATQHTDEEVDRLRHKLDFLKSR